MSGVVDVAAVAADMSSHSVAAAPEAASAHQLIDQLSIKDKSTHTSETDASSPVNTSVDVSSPTASPVSSSSSSDESESRAINSTPTPTSQQVSTSTPTATTDTQVANAPSTLVPTTSSQSSTASAAVLTIAPVIAPVTNSNAETGELLNGGYKRGGAENDPETGYYDEIEIEDMEYDEATRTFTYPCPCGDKFRITKDDLLDGEDIARCPSCSLLVKVIYDPDDLEEED